MLTNDTVYFNKETSYVIASYVDDFLLFGEDSDTLHKLTKSI